MQERITDGHETRPREVPALQRGRRPFVDARYSAIDRLVRAGIPSDLATAWLDAWDRSTIDLPDFRNAPDFWSLGFRFALEEYRRGYRPVAD